MTEREAAWFKTVGPAKIRELKSLIANNKKQLRQATKEAQRSDGRMAYPDESGWGRRLAREILDAQAEIRDYSAKIKQARRTRPNPSKRKTRKRISAALKKYVRSENSRKNPSSVRLKGFTGTVVRTAGGQVIIKGRRKR